MRLIRVGYCKGTALKGLQLSDVLANRPFSCDTLVLSIRGSQEMKPRHVHRLSVTIRGSVKIVNLLIYSGKQSEYSPGICSIGRLAGGTLCPTPNDLTSGQERRLGPSRARRCHPLLSFRGPGEESVTPRVSWAGGGKLKTARVEQRRR